VDPFLFRVIRVHDWPTYDRWVWLDGYELDEHGEAMKRRTIWVQIAGVRRVSLRLRQPGRQGVRGAGGNRR
jgi:hypothetical protein